jgi:BON domain
MSHEYTDAHLQRVLAEDVRIAELGIDVIVSRDDTIVLSGQVESADRCQAIEDRVREECPDCRIVNEIVVVSTDPPVRAEELS